jgi:hypothetical protein
MNDLTYIITYLIIGAITSFLCLVYEVRLSIKEKRRPDTDSAGFFFLAALFWPIIWILFFLFEVAAPIWSPTVEFLEKHILILRGFLKRIVYRIASIGLENKEQ